MVATRLLRVPVAMQRSLYVVSVAQSSEKARKSQVW